MRNAFAAPCDCSPLEDLTNDCCLLFVNLDLAGSTLTGWCVAVCSSAGGATAPRQQLHLVSYPAANLLAVVLIDGTFEIQHDQVVLAARVLGLSNDRDSQLQQFVDISRLHFHVAPETRDILSDQDVELAAYRGSQHRRVSDALWCSAAGLGVGESMPHRVSETLALRNRIADHELPIDAVGLLAVCAVTRVVRGTQFPSAHHRFLSTGAVGLAFRRRIVPAGLVWVASCLTGALNDIRCPKSCQRIDCIAREDVDEHRESINGRVTSCSRTGGDCRGTLTTLSHGVERLRPQWNRPLAIRAKQRRLACCRPPA
ncbi:MAG TPA: hypothetical protein VGM84_12055 [Steroidobacteraceae bacterium]